MSKLNLFFRLTKVDEAQRLVYGIATAEVADKTGEICDYSTTVPYYKAWSDEIHKASGGKSLGNVREMHDSKAVGKLTQINFDDDKKQIEVCAKIVEESTWQKVVEGVLVGFSQGGSYVKTWKDTDNPEFTRYTADPSEISVVDNPCLGSATFEYIKSDGTKEVRKAIGAAPVAEVKQVWLSQDQIDLLKGHEISNIKGDAIRRNTQVTTQADVAPGVKLAQDILKQLDDKEPTPVVDPVVVKSPKARLKRGMQEIARAACLIQEMDWLHGAIEFEKEIEGDNSPNPDHLKSIIKELGEFLCNLCEEEVREMAGGDDDDFMEMAAGLSEAEKSAMLKVIKVDTLHGKDSPLIVLAFELSKAGARHSAADKGRLAEMQGHMDKMAKGVGKLNKLHEAMTETHGKMAEDDNKSTMADHLGKMSKCAASMDKCHGNMQECMKGLGANEDHPQGAEKVLELTAANDTLSKTVLEMTTALEAIQKRLATIERSPAPSKVAVMVTKGDEQPSGKAADEPPFNSVPNAISPGMFRARFTQ